MRVHYPIIRLPREFRGLAGAAATIYQTVHNGAPAFLVVVNSQQGHKLKNGLRIKKEALLWQWSHILVPRVDKIN
jgi:hypothetical protein